MSGSAAHANFFYFSATKNRSARQTEVQPTHTHRHTQLSMSQDTEAGRWGRETKRETDEIDFLLMYLPKRWRISPPVHPDRAWAVSGACCGPWSPGAGPCSLRSPWFLFRAASRTLSAASSSVLHYLIIRPRKEGKEGKNGGNLSPLFWFFAQSHLTGLLSGLTPDHLSNIKHMWGRWWRRRQKATTGPGSGRGGSGGGGGSSSGAPGEAFSRRNRSWKFHGVPLFSYVFPTSPRCYPYLAQFGLHSLSVVMTPSMIHACCNRPAPPSESLELERSSSSV